MPGASKLETSAGKVDRRQKGKESYSLKLELPLGAKKKRERGTLEKTSTLEQKPGKETLLRMNSRAVAGTEMACLRVWDEQGNRTRGADSGPHSLPEDRGFLRCGLAGESHRFILQEDGRCN